MKSGKDHSVVSPIPGQEERNSDHLLEEGIAVKCNDLTTLPFKLEWLLEDPDRLTRMKANALRFAKPTASATIVDTLLEDHLSPLSFTKNQRAAIALAAGPEWAIVVIMLPALFMLVLLFSLLDCSQIFHG